MHTYKLKSLSLIFLVKNNKQTVQNTKQTQFSIKKFPSVHFIISTSICTCGIAQVSRCSRTLYLMQTNFAHVSQKAQRLWEPVLFLATWCLFSSSLVTSSTCSFALGRIPLRASTRGKANRENRNLPSKFQQKNSPLRTLIQIPKSDKDAI